ncbi:hypothetical protein SBRY_11277 [Actinacidiphila bryophytorum]|uniref:Uncharacterized protein n=1 Tax=Actinacidiphila bryophytorum TaxID=1436133 RepID=A0A9W4E1W5_9ACTN|nr:hypothetical protein SBRY_11277 [Actinacidiphila bryophytorum]
MPGSDRPLPGVGDTPPPAAGGRLAEERHGGTARQRRALRPRPAPLPPGLARPARRLGRGARRGDPRCRRSARQRQDDAAALPVGAAGARPGRGVVQQRTRPHAVRRRP